VRVETKLRPYSSSKKQSADENQGLRSEREIELYRKREKAKREKAERREAEAKARQAEAHAREAEAQVRHLNVGLIERVGFFVFAMGVGIVAIIGALSDPGLLKVAVGAGGLGGAVAAARYRFSKRSSDELSLRRAGP
jgi:phage-related minor tail protein